MNINRNSTLLAAALIVASCIGCGKKADTSATTSKETTAPPTVTSQPAATAEASTPSEVKTYVFHGTVKSIDQTNRTITIDHEKIDGYMEAMTMPYKVADPAILAQVKVGDKTHFTLRVAGDQALITKVQQGHDTGQVH